VRAEAFLDVLVRTQIVVPPADTKVILGHVASLTCRVAADLAVPVKVTW
jgi:protein sidekick